MFQQNEPSPMFLFFLENAFLLNKIEIQITNEWDECECSMENKKLKNLFPLYFTARDSVKNETNYTVKRNIPFNV